MVSELPGGWVETTIGEICAMGPKSAWDDGMEIGFVPMSHAPTNFRGPLNYEARRWHEVKKAYTHFENDDVIFAKVTPCFENGKAALVAGLPNGAGAGSSEFHVLRRRDAGISPSYLLAVIKSAQFLREGEENMTGAVGLRRVPRAFVENFPVRLPPEAEQKRIAQKLDALLAQVDTLKARIDAIPALLKRLRQSVLASAASSSLTSDWRKKQNLEEPQVTQIAKLANVVRGASPRPAGHPDFFGGPVPWITVRELTKDQLKLLTATSDSLTEAGRLKSRYIESDTLLLSNSGATLGVPKITRIGGCINDGVVALLDVQEPTKSYLYYFLSSKTEELRSLNQGAAQPNLNTGIVKSIEVRIGSEAEQTEIVRRVEQLFAYAEQLEAKVAAAQQRIDALTQSLLAKAFRGELVPQDPTDEPASVLLERIRTQRAATPKPKRGRKAATS
ncbi:restriction endonuclease subunit S [Xanthomonas oryzae pv. oryzae]|nr:restriction endonuclease subunit S [Xanthomonas oryzae]UXW38152.1 restriction endonuclease subunit S [Xanthomonas oryzae pv. oryzae]